ncbi:MAG: pectate lyase [Prevotella sp.]|nr:pectate lyase [Prevotella sp.]
MKKVLLLLALFLGLWSHAGAEDVAYLKWAEVCNGGMSADWYGSDEAQQIADVVLSVQKNNGGWMKNDQLHKLSASELKQLQNARSAHSCLDNGATTQEMRFLARVYQKTLKDAYKESFTKALHMIFAAEKGCGGWSQYWPLSGNGSYQDYITFNDDLMTNVMMVLDEISQNKGIFANMASDEDRQHCERSFQRAIDVIVKCQVDDNGTPAAWCAQHDTTTFLPAEGRPHEMPSISGYESANLLSYLMTIEHPSEALQKTIHTAVSWLDAHKIDGKAIESFVNDNGENDRRVVDRAGSAIWGRFIQLGGATGENNYNLFFKKLKDRGKKRSYTADGKTYTYTEYEIAANSYNPDKAYQPIYAIYDDQLQHLYYRYLYIYEDADYATDWQGCSVPTSLNALRRVSYQFLGSWPQNVIKSEYPAWKQRMASQEEGEGYQTYVLSKQTNTGTNTSSEYSFDNDITITNEKGKGYANGASNTIKFSANVVYTVRLPESIQVDKVEFYGYDNYDADAYISTFNGTTFSSTDYVFPAKEDGNASYVTHVLSAGSPIRDSFSFTLGAKQCCLIITLYQKGSESGISVPVVIGKDDGAINLLGIRGGQPQKGIYIQKGRKVVVR